MDAAEVQRVLLDRLAIRIGPETAAFLLRHVRGGDSTRPVEVIAADARTGVALRCEIDPSVLAAGTPAAPPSPQ